MATPSDFEPMDSVLGGVRTAIGRGFFSALLVLGVPLGALLIGLGCLVIRSTIWPHYFPPKADITALQRLVPMNLPTREIWYHAEGFADVTVFAMVPMTADEFRKFVREKGMVETSNLSVPSPPRWWKRPNSKLWRLDRLKSSPQSYLMAHYDSKTRRAYICYFDT